MFYRLCVWSPASRFLRIGHKSEKWQWCHHFPTWRHCQDFDVVLFLKFSYWSKFRLNITTGSGVMTISFYKGLTRKLEIGITPVLFLPYIWRLGRVRDTTFGTNVSNEMLLNTPKCQGYSFYRRFWVIKWKPTGGKITSPPQPKLELMSPFY